MIDASAWQEIKVVLDEALDRPPEERQAFLDRSCPDGERRRQVEALLAEEREDFIDQPVYSLRRPWPEEPEVRGHVGPYRLIRRLGKGGMGEVYEAERTGADFRQRVAIKLVKRGMDTEEIVRRFRDERRILAGLEHPNIARLLDGGTTRDGLPYFVMEHVEGEPLDRYCTERRLSTAARLKLFLGVCEAVEQAHRHLVVHRDLKPGNILVTAEGAPKLLDFGIAKLLQTDDGDTPTVTREAGRLMTPTYASPEQIRGEAVTTASDVYSLGVLLFEMLTGRRPFTPEERAPGGAGLRNPPPIPSKVIGSPRGPGEAGGFERHEDPTKLRRELAGDVDAILVKAMAPEPSQRYSSVEQLSQDVRHYLGGRPVQARPPSWLYHTRKLVRRRRKELTAVAAVLALVVSLVVLGLERRNVAAERQRAQNEYENGQKLSRFMVRVLESADPTRTEGEELSPVEMLNRCATDAGEYLKDFPATRAAIVHAVGGIFHNRGQYDRARELFDESLRLRRLAFGERSWQVGGSLNDLAYAYQFAGDYATAEHFYREALDRPHFGPDGNPAMVALVLDNLGITLRDEGKLKEAEDAHRQGLDIRRQLYGRDHDTIASSLNNLAIVVRQTGRYDEAEALYRESLAVQQRLYPGEPHQCLTTISNLGKLQCERGHFAEGEAALREGLELRRSIYRTVDHPNVAYSLREIGVCRQLQGDLAEAEELYREAVAIYERRQENDHPHLGVTWRELANVLAAGGGFTAALETIDRALDVYRRRLPANHWRIADAESVRGGCLLGLGRADEAAPLIERSYRTLAAVRGEATREVREARERRERLRAVAPASISSE